MCIPGIGSGFRVYCNIMGQDQYDELLDGNVRIMKPNENLLFRVICNQCKQEVISTLPSNKFIITLSKPIRYGRFNKELVKPLIIRKIRSIQPPLNYENVSKVKAKFNPTSAFKPQFLKESNIPKNVKSKMGGKLNLKRPQNILGSHLSYNVGSKLNAPQSNLERLFLATNETLMNLEKYGQLTSASSLSKFYDIPAWIVKKCNPFYKASNKSFTKNSNKHKLYRNVKDSKNIIGCTVCKRLEYLSRREIK